MALKATIFKAELQVSDLDRNRYGDYTLTIARHPSETDERMMVRLLVFALHADEALAFTRGLSTDDEPDLWLKSLSDEIELWIDLGQPDEKRLRRACGRAKRVVVYNYGGRSGDVWWEQNHNRISRFDNLTVVNLPAEQTQALAQMAQRTMRLQVTVQDAQAWVSDGTGTVQVEPAVRLGPGLHGD